MAQTHIGAMKLSAKKAGLTLEQYLEHINSGEKLCMRCKTWKPISDFGHDRTRHDGLDCSCFSCRRVKERKSTKGRVSWFKGKKHTQESIEKMRLAAKNRPSNRIGKKHSLETRKKISEVVRERTPRGQAVHTFKDGKVQERRGQRFSVEYRRWRFDVFMRDKFTCQECGDDKGGNLVAHHIKSFADFPELRFEISNGITLCTKCHKKHHPYK